MGRVKRKNSLQLRNSYMLKHDSQSNKFSSDDENSVDENRTENLQLLTKNPIFLNHIKGIVNVGDGVLEWDLKDVMDEKSNHLMHSSVNRKAIQESMKNSVFGSFLLPQIRDIDRISAPATGGAIMLQRTSNLNLKVDSNLEKLSSEIRLGGAEQLNVTSSNSKRPLETANRANLAEGISGTVSPVCKSEPELLVTATAAGPPLRRSGRAVKVDYATMVNIQIFDHRRPAIDPGPASPKKKSSVKKSVSRSSASDASDVEAKLEKKKRREKEKLEEKVEADWNVEGEKVAPEKREASPSVGDGNLEETKEEEKEEEREDSKEQSEAEEGDAAAAAEQLVESALDQKLETGDRARKRASAKTRARRLHSKKRNKSCVLCSKPVVPSRAFQNLCFKCSSANRKVVQRLRVQDQYSCVAEPPCWSRGDESGRCDACTVQNLIRCQVAWGPEFEHLDTLTLEMLRAPEAVAKARQVFLTEGERFLATVPGLASNGSVSSCILSASDPQSTPCRWDVRFFSMVTDISGASCTFCETERKDTGQVELYSVLPSRKCMICRDCLLLAHRTANGSEDHCEKHPGPCTDIGNCGQCLMTKLEPIVPLDAVKYRFTVVHGNTETWKEWCELCRRRDSSIASVLRSGPVVCLACVWRIKTHFLRGDGPCPSSGSCPSVFECGACLTGLAERVLDLHVLLTHTHSPAPNRSAASKSMKRSMETDGPVEPRPKKQCVSSRLAIDSNWSAAGGDGRPKRVIKSSQFSDYIVDTRCLLRSTVGRTVQQAFGIVERKFEDSFCEENEDKEEPRREREKICENGGVEDNELDEKENQIEVASTAMETKDNKEVGLGDREEEEEKEAHCGDGARRSEEKSDSPIKERNEREGTPKMCRRIKQAMSPAATVPEKERSPVPCRSSGPRVKQVSRQSVNVEVNLDSVRQKCVVKRGNRVVKKPDRLSGFIVDHVVEHADNSHDDDDQSNGIETPIDQLTPVNCHASPVHQFSSRCGSCNGCARNRCCGKCGPCLVNKSQRRKTEICMKMRCTATVAMERQSDRRPIDSIVSCNEDYDGDGDGDGNEDEDECLAEAVDTAKINTIKSGGTVGVSEVFRDSASEEECSDDEEVLDPENDSIDTVKGDVISASQALDGGGFPVVTSARAQPNKVLCFSCGSGGDQLINCVSCAEPFHFFCIEFQFRPKSKEMFVCRNCTKCRACDGYGSDLKCIKCQLGFHPKCVDRYPPSRSEDRSDWACYQCAMCLHCGAKAEDAMGRLTKTMSQIDWSRDPWQCGKCARARKEGHVCPECGRAYQSCLETIDCGKCGRLVHRQCSGLTEDEYEVLKCEPVSSRDESVSFSCAKCSPSLPDGDDCKKRERLKRRCKESNLKKYCERGVSRRMSEFIQRAGDQEEMLLEQGNLSDGAPGCRASLAALQMDGVDDDDEGEGDSDSSEKPVEPKEGDFETLASSSPVPTETVERDMNQTSSTLYNSSESIEEYDIDQLNAALELDASGTSRVDLDSVETDSMSASRAKFGIFSRLAASDFLSPKHLVMEVLARALLKVSRYPAQSQIAGLYNALLELVEQLCHQIFPWIDFQFCLDSVHAVTKRNSGRLKLVIQAIVDGVRDSASREIDVFSSSIAEIEEKLRNSFQKGREEFVMFHSNEHLAALMKYLETQCPGNVQFSNYRLAFDYDDSNTICEKDIRSCALCGYSGDDGLEGRLIYGGHDVWVHVNCALWSDEVFEREDGALVNVDAAIRRGEASICSGCNNFGATVRCSAGDSLDGYEGGCQNVFHFGCAYNLLGDPVFTESRTFYCSEMHESLPEDDQQLGLADMLILRRIYLPQGCLKSVASASPKGIPSDQVVVTMGNLRIESLGKIDLHADYFKVALCPDNFRARRLFWSMTELDTLVMYYMTVAREPSKSRPGDESVVQHVSVPVTVSPSMQPVKHKRRIIETGDSRSLKRWKPTSLANQRIVYEMDEDGNLQPASGSSSLSGVRDAVSRPRELAGDHQNRKVNRRFPINIKSNSATQPLPQDSNRFIDPDPSGPGQVPESSCPSPVSSVPSSKMQVSTSSFPVYQQNFLRNLVRHHPSNSIDNQILTNRVNLRLQRPQLQPQMPAQSLSHNHQNTQSPSVPLNVFTSTVPRVLSVRKLPPAVPAQLTRPIKLVSTQAIRPINIQSSPNVIRVVPVVTGNHSNTQPTKVLKLVRLPSSTPFPAQIPPRSSSLGSGSSVLRTVLTDNNHSFSTRPVQRNNESPYFISSCGTLAPWNQALNLPQFDGADDGDTCCLQPEETVPRSSANSVCSDHENATGSGQPQASRGPLGLEIRFLINGFKNCKSPKSCWSYLVRKVIQLRKTHGLPEYPIKTGDGWAKFGLEHRHVLFLLEQLPNAFQCSSYEFQFHKARALKLRLQASMQRSVSTMGCARFTPFSAPRPSHVARDPLAFLLSRTNRAPHSFVPPDVSELEQSCPEPGDDYLEKLACQFRDLNRGQRCRERDVRVCVSVIHGRGLFSRRGFEPHEIIIEYVGELIRSSLSDVREAAYQKAGIDCYMFRLDQDFIVDATCQGNAARFINHSCNPNCYAKVVRFGGQKHIIIIALRMIYKGEELTYNYRFPIEDDKLVCTCGSFSCKKYLN